MSEILNALLGSNDEFTKIIRNILKTSAIGIAALSLLYLLSRILFPDSVEKETIAKGIEIIIKLTMLLILSLVIFKMGILAVKAIINEIQRYKNNLINDDNDSGGHNDFIEAILNSV